jgi:signal peptidase I
VISRYWPLLAAAAGAVSVLYLRRRFAIVTVTGQSMLPALRDGDRILVRRVGLERIRAGDVVVVEKPDDGDTGWRQPPAVRVAGHEWLIKRAAAVPDDPLPEIFLTCWPARPDDLVPAGKLLVLGDNSAGSYDSRAIGYIPGERLLGVLSRRMTGGSD